MIAKYYEISERKETWNILELLSKLLQNNLSIIIQKTLHLVLEVIIFDATFAQWILGYILWFGQQSDQQKFGQKIRNFLKLFACLWDYLLLRRVQFSKNSQQLCYALSQWKITRDDRHHHPNFLIKLWINNFGQKELVFENTSPELMGILLKKRGFTYLADLPTSHPKNDWIHAVMRYVLLINLF